MEIRSKHLITAIVVLLAFVFASVLLYKNKPTGRFKSTQEKPTLNVETLELKETQHQFILSSFGNVQPRTQSLLVAQVSGQIVAIDPAFRDGGFFSKGDVLVQIDDRDYIAAVNIARAELMQSRLSLAEEKARANQALIDWERLGNGEQAPDLVLRKPQLAVAEAQILSAQANFEKAKLNLERAQITAPYDGRVKSKQVDVGQYVNSSTQLATIFASDLLEIRLPLKNTDLPYIQLPEHFQDRDTQASELPNVTISSDLGGHYEWQGKIVRTEAAIDEQSHQLYVVAQIENPYARDNDRQSTLKIGQYVTAQIEGLTLPQTIVIPNSSIYQGSYVYLADKGLLQRREISIGFQNDQQAFVTKGLEAGDQLITSPLGQVTSGTLVNSINDPQLAQKSDTTLNDKTLNNTAMGDNAGAKP